MARKKQRSPISQTKPENGRPLTQWAPVVGSWQFPPNAARFVGPQEPTTPHGIALSAARLKRGTVSFVAELDEPKGGAARVLFGYDTRSGAYFSAGIGGYNEAYVIDEFIPGTGWRSLKHSGSNANLVKKRKYKVSVRLEGQSAQVLVDQIAVAEVTLPHPLLGDQVGLLAWGAKSVTFHEPHVTEGQPRAFVVMQFAEPYNSLYVEVIKPVAERAGFSAFRGDDVFRPGIILQDIVRSIVSADVIVAEITPANPNVFYELGYAHAIDKPTVLLAEKPPNESARLPFDVSGFRVIFYDNSIRGKRVVEELLQQHLTNIKEGRTAALP